MQEILKPTEQAQGLSQAQDSSQVSLVESVVADQNKAQSQSVSDEELFANAGINIAEEKKKIAQEQTKSQFGAQIEKALPGALPTTETKKPDLGKEVINTAVGAVADSGQTIVNGIITASDFMGNLIKRGMGQPEDAPTDRVKFGDAIPQPQDPGAKVLRAVGAYAAPLAASMGAGVAVLPATVINGVVDFLGQNPEGTRASDLIQEVPWMRNPISEYLATDPNDTEMMARTKNGLESMLFAGIFGSVAKAIPKGVGALKDGFDAGKKLLNADLVQDAAKVLSESLDIEKTVKASKVKQVTEQAGAAAKELKPDPVLAEKIAKAYPDTPAFKLNTENLGGVAQDTKEATKIVGINLTKISDKDEVLQTVKEFADTNKEVIDTVRNRMDFDEIKAEAAELLKDPANVNRLLGDAVEPTTEALATQIVAHKIIVSASADELVKHIDLVINDATDVAAKSAFNDALDSFGVVYGAMRSKQTDVATGLAAGRIVVDPSVFQGKRLEMMNQAIKLSDKQDLPNLAKTLKAIQNMPDSEFVERMGHVLELTKYSKFSQAASFATLNNLLSLKSAAAAVVGNFFNYAVHNMDNFNAAVIGTMKNTPDGATMKSFGHQINGQLMAMSEAFSNAGRSLMLNKSVSAVEDSAKFDFGFGNPISGKNLMGVTEDSSLGMKAVGKVLDAYGFVQTLPTRMILPADAFFSTLIYRGEQYAQSMRKAEALGLSGAEAGEFVAKSFNQYNEKAAYAAQTVTLSRNLSDKSGMGAANGLTYTKEIDNIASAAAKKKGLSGTEAQKFVENYKQKMVTTEDHAIALSKAQEYENRAQPLAEFHDWTNSEHPLAKVLLPVFKTTVNDARFVMEHSPFMLTSSTVRADIKAGGKAGEMAMAKVMTGLQGVGLLTGLAAAGLVTGETAKNRALESAIKENDKGRLDNSIKIGGNWVSVDKFGIAGSFVRLGAFLADSHNYLSEGEYADLVLSGAGAVADAMTPESYIQTIGAIADAVGQATYPSGRNDAAIKLLEDVGQRFVPLAGIQKQAAQMIDPVVPSKVTNTTDQNLIEAFITQSKALIQGKTPFLSKDIPPVRNMWGEAMIPTPGWGPDMLSPFTKSSSDESELNLKLRELSGFSDKAEALDPDWPGLKLTKQPDFIANKFSPGDSFQLSAQEHDRLMLYSAGIDPDTGEVIFPGGQSLKSKMEELVLGDTVTELLKRENGRDVVKATIVEIKKVVNDYYKFGREMLMSDPEIQQRMQDEANTRRERFLE